MIAQALHILMVDDDVGDLRLAREAIERENQVATLHFVHDGMDALAFLRREDPFKDRPHIDCVIMDLTMPRMTGFECLEEIRKDVGLEGIPVFILTASVNPRDQARAKSLGAAGYLVKPRDMDEYLDLVGEVHNQLTAL